MNEETTNEIRVLVVDDDRSHAEMAVSFLEHANDHISANTAASGPEGYEKLKDREYDCVVSDYEMPEQNGIEFLQSVRNGHIDLPFILFTGKGSEEIASEAISAGVTDYLQKETGTSQYDVLANRIENAVQQFHGRRELQTTTQFYGTVLHHSSDFVMIVDEMGLVSYISPAVERMLGYPPETVRDTNAFEFVHEDDQATAATTLAGLLEEPENEQTVEFRAKNASGEYRWLEVRGRNLLDDPIISGVMVNARDITERKQREQALENEKARLGDLTEHLSHDVRNQLNVIDSRIELAQGEIDSDHLDHAKDAVNRVDEMLEKTMELAESGQLAAAPAPTSLEEIADRCWFNVGVDIAELIVEDDLRFKADEERLKSMLENLMLNAIEHAGPAVTIRIGPLPESSGFFVEDDGPGIPADQRKHVFESGYSTSEKGAGLGLRIVKAIADAHDWEVTLVEGTFGGGRFEVTNVESLE